MKSSLVAGVCRCDEGFELVEQQCLKGMFVFFVWNILFLLNLLRLSIKVNFLFLICLFFSQFIIRYQFYGSSLDFEIMALSLQFYPCIWDISYGRICTKNLRENRVIISFSMSSIQCVPKIVIVRAVGAHAMLDTISSMASVNQVRKLYLHFLDDDLGDWYVLAKFRQTDVCSFVLYF